jgi:hypothetical protein
MENSNTSYGTQSEYLKDDDLIYPCNDVAERHKYACYQLVTARIRLVKPGWKEIAAECRRSEPEWEATCFESMGRDVSGDAGQDTRKAVQRCRAAGPDEIECDYGVAREIVNADSGGERAARFCGQVPRENRMRCFEGVGTVLTTLHTTNADKRRACAELAGRYARDCQAGAGVPAA